MEAHLLHHCWDSKDLKVYAQRATCPSTDQGSGTGWKTRTWNGAGTGRRKDREGSNRRRGRAIKRDRWASGVGAAGGVAAALRAVLCNWRIRLETF